MSDSRLVGVAYDPTPRGVNAIRFAASLAVQCGELRVLLPGSPDPAELPGLFDQVVEWTVQRSSPSLFGWKERRDAAALMPVGDPATFVFGPDSILVGASTRRDVHVLAPRAESSVYAGVAMVPLGNRESGQYVLERGLPLLRGVGFHGVVFYHTTYRNPDVTSDAPGDHMDPGAVDLLGTAERAARALGLSTETMVETSPKVSDGVIAAALAARCSLIVMARGLARRGTGYVDEVLEASPVPVLVVGRQTEVK